MVMDGPIDLDYCPGCTLKGHAAWEAAEKAYKDKEVAILTEVGTEAAHNYREDLAKALGLPVDYRFPLLRRVDEFPGMTSEVLEAGNPESPVEFLLHVDSSATSGGVSVDVYPTNRARGFGNWLGKLDAAGIKQHYVELQYVAFPDPDRIQADVEALDDFSEEGNGSKSYLKEYERVYRRRSRLNKSDAKEAAWNAAAVNAMDGAEVARHLLEDHTEWPAKEKFSEVRRLVDALAA